MPDAVAQRREIFVGRVFAEFEPVGANICVDFAAPECEQGTNNRKIDSTDMSRGNFAHGGEAR